MDSYQYNIVIDLDKNELYDLLYGEIEIDKNYLSIEENNSIKIKVKLKYKEIEDWVDNSLDNPNQRCLRYRHINKIRRQKDKIST